MAVIPTIYQRSRSRTDGAFTNVSRLRYDRSLSGACTGTYSNTETITSQVGSVRTKVILDCKTPGFQALRKLGKFVSPLPVHIEQVHSLKTAVPYPLRRAPATGPCAGVNVTYHDGLINHISPWGIPDVPWNDVVLNAVINEAVARARVASWDVLTDLAELKQTIALFREGHQLLGASIGQIARGAAPYLRSPRAFAKAVSSGWLRYRYGVMPTLYSLQDACEAFTRKTRTYAFGRSFASESDFITAPLASGDTGTETYTATETFEYTRKYRGFSAADFEVISDSFRFDPLTTAYELVTLSFVLDWFIDIGTWLEAVSPFAAGNTKVIMGSVQTTSTRTQHWDINAYSTPLIIATGSLSNNSFAVTTETYDRFYATTSLPGWNPRLNLPRMTDAISLAMGLRTKARTTLKV